jgi:hypothetical protein
LVFKPWSLSENTVSCVQYRTNDRITPSDHIFIENMYNIIAASSVVAAPKTAISTPFSFTFGLVLLCNGSFRGTPTVAARIPYRLEPADVTGLADRIAERSASTYQIKSGP